MKSCVLPSPSSFCPGTSKSLMPTPQVVLRSGFVGTVSLEKRTQAGKKHLLSHKTGKRKRQLRAEVIDGGKLARKYVLAMGGHLLITGIAVAQAQLEIGPDWTLVWLMAQVAMLVGCGTAALWTGALGMQRRVVSLWTG